MNKLRYTERIFEILSKGKFISSNSVSAEIKRYYDEIEDGFEEYYGYFEGIGFVLESGDGYYYFSRREQRVDIERKLEAFGKWIDYLDFMKTFNASFGVGFVFRKAQIMDQLSCDIELKEKSSKLFPDLKRHDDVVDKIIDELEKQGFAELENEMESSYKVTSAFHYLEEMIDCITVNEEMKDEIPE